MAQIEFPQALFERVRAGNCILCTGLRFAALAGMPTWDDLFSRMSAKLGPDEGLKQLISEGKFLTVAGYLKRKLGADSCTGILQEAYGKSGAVPEPLEILRQIPFRGAISTGYDTLAEGVMARNGTKPKVYTYADGAVLRLSEDLKDYVVKAHGDVAHPTPLVLDRLDYKRVIGPNQAYRAFLEDLYRTHTLLIVGYRPSDPDFVLFLERLLATFRDAVTDHYALLSGLTGPEQEELYANYRVRVIPYEDGDDPVKAMTATLEQLASEWRSRGSELPSLDDPAKKIEWLTQRLAPVEVRIDVLAAEGLALSDARLDAIRQAASTIKLQDLDPESLCRLGNVLHYMGDAARAVECYRAALAKSPKMAAAHLNLHHGVAELKNFPEALEHLNQATALDPSLRTIPERYTITAVIGRGTTGTIYQAQDTQEKRQVTVKVLRASYVREHVSPERWLRETQELEGLEHPNLVRVQDALIEGGRCILVTDSLSGKSLSRTIREEGALAPEKALRILQPVCEGIVHAHSKGVLHLDLTPSNIFLRDDGTVAVMDFRTGRAQKGRFVTEKGAEGYQAPELLAGAGGDARADVYSLGAILYTMLTGKAPLGSFPRPSEVNPQTRRYDLLVARAMRALPDERPQTALEFAKALASSSEELVLPEREDDLEGWCEVLKYQPDHPRAREVLGKLEATYRKDKAWDSLLALLLERVGFEVEPETREKLLREVAQIFEREVGDLGKAFAALQAAFRENSSSAEIRKELERLAGATGLWNELLQEYTQLVQHLRDPKVACDWWVRMGRLYSNELGHDDYAMASFNQALALDSNRVDALSELAEVLKRKSLHKDYVKTLTRLAELEPDAARRVEALKDLARTSLKELASEEDALAAYRKILELDPQQSSAVAALEGLYRKGENWKDLAELLRSRVELSEVAADQRSYRHSLAEILSEKLSQPEAAIEQYQALLQADPDDMVALKALERLYDSTNRRDDYLQILDRRISAAAGIDEKVSLCRRMAAEWEAQEGGRAKAAEYLEKIVALKGGDDETNKGLVRLYWALCDHPKLAVAYQRQIRAAESPADRVGLYAALGKVYEDHLKDDAKAIETFQSILTLEEDNRIALGALARLYQKTCAWPQAVQMLRSLSTKEENVDKQVEIFYRIGAIQQEHLNKLDEAEASLAKALELKDTHVDSLMALAALYRERKDFGKAGRMLCDAARSTGNELEKVKRLFQAGLTYQDDLGNEAKAQEVFEELLAIDPEHVQAGDRLVALYEKGSAAAKAEPILDALVRKADPRDRGRLIELNLKLARAAREGGHQDKALRAYRTAYDLDPTNQLALRPLADLLFERGEHDESGKLYQALLVHRRESMAGSDIVDVFFKLGEVKEKLGEKNKALNMYEKALDVDPMNAKVLQQVMRLYEEKNDLEAVLRCHKALLKGATDDETRVRLNEEIGDLLHERMKRGTEAIQFYRAATELKPDSRRVLNKIMDVFVEQKKWDEAITAMGKIEDYETDGGHRARLHYTAAVILRDELKRPEDAAWHLDQALSKDPTHRKAFDALRVLYTKQGNWKGLAKAYRLMLHRLPESTPLEEQVRLWHEMGEICQDKLRDFKEAIIAFEVAAKLDPANEVRQDNLALLYTSAGPDFYDKAILSHHRLLKANPLRLETYKELRRLYGELKQVDKEWCVAAVLSELKKASPEEQALYEKRRSEKPRRVTRKLSDDLWQSIYHPWQDPILTAIFSAVQPVVAPLAVKAPSVWGLKPTERLDLGADKRPYAKMVQYVAQVLDQTPGECYVQRETKDPATLLLSGTPAEMVRVLRISPTLIESKSESELCYWLTRALSLLRPELSLSFATPSAVVLRALSLACLKLVQPTIKLAGDVDEIHRLTEVLRQGLTPARLNVLATSSASIPAAIEEGKIERWLSAVSLSTSRAALLLCDDLSTAARMISVEPEQALKPTERLRELLLFAVSEPYFKLREALGLKIG